MVCICPCEWSGVLTVEKNNEHSYEGVIPTKNSIKRGSYFADTLYIILCFISGTSIKADLELRQTTA